MANEGPIRHSVAEEATLVRDAEAIARKEAANSLLQAQRVKDMILAALHGDRSFKLRPSMFLDLNRCAIQGLSAYAGNWRPAGVEIRDSAHEPPGAHLVPELIEDLCEYVNDSWSEKTAIHLSAFVMWRANWIHPFSDGNGRTARAVSYLLLCVRDGLFLPGLNTIPEQIVANRRPYYDALEAADRRFMENKAFADDTVLEMEELLAPMLARQLTDAFKHATGEV